MNGFLRQNEVVGFLKAALECSIYHAPTVPGLTLAELRETAGRAGFKPGEVSDAINEAADVYWGGAETRLVLKSIDTTLLMHFAIRVEEPDYRNPEAFDFVFEQLREIGQFEGARHAKIERRVLVERAAGTGLLRRDVEVAVTIMLWNAMLKEERGLLSFAPGRENYASPSEQLRQGAGRHPVHQNAGRARAYPIVGDVVARREDGRPRLAEPLPAFADELEKLGYRHLRLWWAQMLGEYGQTSPQATPVAATVLSAALMEGALTFVVKHAMTLNIGPMGSKTFEGSPTGWKLEHLIESAARGGSAAILDGPARQRAEALNRSRQRIHAGRMLADFPGGPPDLRPEEAREARATAELVVRSILDWLQRYPA